jgi:LysM repeat protein
VRDKLVQGGLLPNLVTQAGPLFQTLGESIQTNLTLDQLVQLIQLGAQIEPGHIQLQTVGPDLILPLHVDSNPPQDALVLKPDVSRQLRAYLLGAGAITATVTPSAPVVAGATATVPVGGDSGLLRTYTVQPGDTLFSLAARFGRPLEDLKAANGLVSDDIQAGQQLIIP